MHLATVVLHIVGFLLKHGGLYAFLAQELDERIVFRKTLKCSKHQQSTFFALLLVVAQHELLGIGKQRGHQLALAVVKSLYYGLILLIHLVVALGHRT